VCFFEFNKDFYKIEENSLTHLNIDTQKLYEKKSLKNIEYLGESIEPQKDPQFLNSAKHIK
jgi:hypothetical protein